MKRNTIILAAVSAVALGGLTTMALAESDRFDDDDYRKGNCMKGERGYGKHMRGHHRGDGFGMGMGMMGGEKMGRFMKDGNFDLQLTPERVKEIMEGKLAWRGNPNLKVGDVSADKDGNIIAQLVTKDDSLVQTFKVDPKTGARTPLN